MKKILLFVAVLLSGCARDITVYHHYDIDTPASKARLYIAEPDTSKGGPYQPVLNDPVVQKTWKRYFIKSDKQNADFILKLTEWDNEPKGSDGACFLFSVLSLGIVPSWESYEGLYKHSLTRTQTGKSVSLSDIKEKTRYYVGWLFLPMAFAPKTRITINRNNFSPWVPSILANAIEEAASLVYDTNSRLYQQTPRWTPPAPAKHLPTINAAPVSAPVAAHAPANEPSPEEMDLLW